MSGGGLPYLLAQMLFATWSRLTNSTGNQGHSRNILGVLYLAYGCGPVVANRPYGFLAPQQYCEPVTGSVADFTPHAVERITAAIK